MTIINMENIKNVISTIVLINSIIDNYDKIKKVYRIAEYNILPLISYISGCRCSVCMYNRSHNKKSLH
jgi:hypothetical protein